MELKEMLKCHLKLVQTEPVRITSAEDSKKAVPCYGLPAGYPWRDLPPAVREPLIEAFLDAGGSGVLHYDIFSKEDYQRQLAEFDDYLSAKSIYYEAATFVSLREQVVREFGPRYGS